MTPDGRIVFLDHDTFQTGAFAPRDTAGSGVSIDLDFSGDTMTFADTTDLSNPPVQPELNSLGTQTSSQDDPRTLSTSLDDLSALYPGSDPTPDTSSPPDPSIAMVQGIGPAGLDWWVTPDYDDDPGWYPGWIPSSSSSPSTLGADEGSAPTSSAITSSMDEPPVTSSLTAADLNELYPGIVWPANWWLL